MDPGRYLLYAAVILVASGAAVGVAWMLSPMSTWVRRVVALAAAGAVALFAVLEVESSLGISALVVVASGAIAAVFAHIVVDLRVLTWLGLSAAAADVISFLFGPTRFLLESGPRAGGYARYLAVGFETLDGVALVVGFGDLVFMGVFTLALWRLGAVRVAGFAAPATGLLVALAVGLAVGGTVGIPLAATPTILYARFRLRKTRPEGIEAEGDGGQE